MSLAIVPLYLWSLVVFLLPGLALIAWLASRRALRPTYAVMLLFVSGGAVGYVAFGFTSQISSRERAFRTSSPAYRCALSLTRL